MRMGYVLIEFERVSHVNMARPCCRSSMRDMFGGQCWQHACCLYCTVAWGTRTLRNIIYFTFSQTIAMTLFGHTDECFLLR